MNIKKAKLRVRTSFNFIVIALFVAGMLATWTESVFSQTAPPDTVQARSSRPGEIQSDHKPQRKKNASAMDMARPPAAVKIGGKVQRMETQKAPKFQAQQGNSQPAVVPTQAANPKPGKGMQKQKMHEGQTAIRQTDSHLRLVLRVTEKGDAEVLNAVEVHGQPVMSDALVGNFVYEVGLDKQTLALQSIQDPFELRGFPGPAGTAQEGHHIGRAKMATIVVIIPGLTLASKELDKMKISLYKIEPEKSLNKIDTEVIENLKRQKNLKVLFDISGRNLATQIRQMGKNSPRK